MSHYPNIQFSASTIQWSKTIFRVLTEWCSQALKLAIDVLCGFLCTKKCLHVGVSALLILIHQSPPATEAFQGQKLSMFLQHNNNVLVKFVTPMPPLLSASVDSVWCFHDNFGTPCLSALNACLLPSLWGAAYLANYLSHVYLSVSEKHQQKVPSVKYICILDTSIWHTHVGFPRSPVWRSSLWALSLMSSSGLLFRDFPPEAKRLCGLKERP